MFYHCLSVIESITIRAIVYIFNVQNIIPSTRMLMFIIRSRSYVDRCHGSCRCPDADGTNMRMAICRPSSVSILKSLIHILIRFRYNLCLYWYAFLNTIYDYIATQLWNPTLGLPHEGPNIRTFDISFVVCQYQLLSNQLNDTMALTYRQCNVITHGIIWNFLATTKVRLTIRSWLLLHDVSVNFGKFACMIYRVRNISGCGRWWSHGIALTTLTKKGQFEVWKIWIAIITQTTLPSAFPSTKHQFKVVVCRLNTSRPRQNGRHFADDIFKCIFLNENVWIPIKMSLKFVPKGPISNIPALV